MAEASQHTDIALALGEPLYYISFMKRPALTFKYGWYLICCESCFWRATLHPIASIVSLRAFEFYVRSSREVSDPTDTRMRRQTHHMRPFSCKSLHKVLYLSSFEKFPWKYNHASAFPPIHIAWYRNEYRLFYSVEYQFWRSRQIGDCWCWLLTWELKRCFIIVLRYG
jgi:hypothetical protein